LSKLARQAIQLEAALGSHIDGNGQDVRVIAHGM
jgi:hypothetical protein